MHYFYNSKTKCDRQKQIAYLKSALKSTLIKKEKKSKKIDTRNHRNNTVSRSYFCVKYKKKNSSEIIYIYIYIYIKETEI